MEVEAEEGEDILKEEGEGGGWEERSDFASLLSFVSALHKKVCKFFYLERDDLAISSWLAANLPRKKASQANNDLETSLDPRASLLLFSMPLSLPFRSSSKV